MHCVRALRVKTLFKIEFVFKTQYAVIMRNTDAEHVGGGFTRQEILDSSKIFLRMNYRYHRYYRYVVQVPQVLQVRSAGTTGISSQFGLVCLGT